MPTPKDVFTDPQAYWTLLTAPTDVVMESQHFDRKEAGNPDHTGVVSSARLDRLKDHVVACVSAFANANPTGGLVVLGIASDGRVTGTAHLRDEQRNDLANMNNTLVHHAAQSRLLDCTNASGAPDRICLIYVPYAERDICETRDARPKAWSRHGAQNLALNDEQRERIRRDKRIVDFERSWCCTFVSADVDVSLLKEFRSYQLVDAHYSHDYQDALYHAGAVIGDAAATGFTRAGLLFFATNPQRLMPAAQIRLLRFEVPLAARDQRGMPTFDRVFGGPVTKQIRDLREFFRSSAFFKTYQRRKSGGGFEEEPEYPPIAVDEAVVNAVAHRDYGANVPIECEKYTDAFVVRNPGRLLQRDGEVPSSFTLDTTRLAHLPRNPKLFEWLKSMRDAHGAEFVRALSEGTRRMLDDMRNLGLPSPEYTVTEAQTIVILRNNADARERPIGPSEELPEHANLFALTARTEDGRVLDASDVGHRRADFVHALQDALRSHGWYVDSYRVGRVTAHRRGLAVPIPEAAAAIVRLLPAYCFQVRQYWGQSYLCLDYSLVVQNVQHAAALLATLSPDAIQGRAASVRWQGWQRGRILELDAQSSLVRLFDFERVERIPSNLVIPDLPTRVLENLLRNAGVFFDLAREAKRASLALEKNAARVRAERTNAPAEELAATVFPLRVGDAQFALTPAPAPLLRNGSPRMLQVRTLPEPAVLFARREETPDIRDGITRAGAYDDAPKTIELVPVCSVEQRDRMAALIERLKVGAYKYRGAERTFHTRLTYSSIITVPAIEQTLAECRRLLAEHPEWKGDAGLPRIFLVESPERGYALDDERSPYYEVKRLLLEHGVPCQMLDTPTLLDPTFKDLNLALNITAKCGVTPWVLPESIPDADCFIGLSYTKARGPGGERLMAFANVFNNFGRWMFYSGSLEAFPYEERIRYFSQLVRDAVGRLPLSETPRVYFHYSKRFSREEVEAILGAARSVHPRGTYSFVWINTDHIVRLYDDRPETDGSLSRGSYVVASPNQILLSTTGYNPYRKTLGTPHMLEVNIRVEDPPGAVRSAPDLRALGAQVLSLTKLNWASTDSLCAEPITTKYAGGIAYLTAAFVRQDPTFRLHPVLERTPWFI